MGRILLQGQVRDVVEGNPHGRLVDCPEGAAEVDGVVAEALVSR